MSNLQDDITKLVLSLGGSFAGFSNVKDKLPGSLKKYPGAVTVGVRLSDAIIDEITDRPTYTYFHHYRSVNTLIDQITLKVMLFIQECGCSAYAVPASQTVYGSGGSYSGVFPHKTAAVMAGLGWIGRSGLFISACCGPRLRLGTILTDMLLPVGNQMENRDCGSCRLCIDSCPAQALAGNDWKEGCEREHILDAKACSDYMNANFKHIGRGSVCGICMRVCPLGSKQR